MLEEGIIYSTKIEYRTCGEMQLIVPVSLVF